MANRRVSARHVKSRRTYNVCEAAKVVAVTEATIRDWLAKGLEAVEGVSPTIIRGVDIIAYLKQRSEERRKPCGPGRLFCFSCDDPKTPAYDEVEFWPDGPKTGVLTGLCPDCASTLKRRTSLATIDAATGNLKVTIRRADSRLSGTP
jgi:hypothetical protein